MNLDIPVSEMMTRKVVSVKPSQKLNDVKDLFRTGQFHYNIPVIEDNKIKGMVVLTDFMFAIQNEAADREEKNYSDLLIKDIMRERVHTRTSTTPVREIAGMFSGGEAHTVMIVDDGQLKGIVSTADIIRYLVTKQPGSKQ
jgi:CBS-domain-containing membrane protein